MTTLRHTTYRICTALLFCLLQMAGIVLYGQDDPRASLKRAHRLPPADTVAVLQHRVADADTIPLLHRLPAASAADSGSGPSRTCVRPARMPWRNMKASTA